MRLRNFIKRHSILLYFLFAFAISWVSIFILSVFTGLPSMEQIPMKIFSLAFLAMIAGPSLTGIILTRFVDGSKGLRELISRQTKWRVCACWYGASLLLIPLILIVLVSSLSIISPIFTLGIISAEDKIAFISFGIIAASLAGFFEEIGWTGFALLRVQARYGVLAAAFIVGVLHGAWHFLADYWGSATTFSSLFLPRIFLWIVAITALRFLISWIYNNTRSLLLAQMMHASFTGGQALLQPSLTPSNYMVYYASFTIILWVVVVAIITIFGKTLVRQSSRL
jgi:membrane protease YdiL (CAAX protease family)